MEDQIISCASCGGKNRIPGSAVASAAKAKCGHCGASLAATSVDDAAGIRPAVIETRSTSGRGAAWVVALIVIAGGGLAYYFFAGRTDTSSEYPVASEVSPAPAPDVSFETPAPEAVSDVPPLNLFPESTDTPLFTPEPAPAPESTLVQQYASPGVQNNWTGAELVAPLSIVTSTGQDYYVKLVYPGSNTEAVSYYVQGGSTADFMAPLGSYELRYASGTTWYGQTDLFGPYTSYAKALESFDFQQNGDEITGYTVTLILQENGNLSTLGLSASEF